MEDLKCKPQQQQKTHKTFQQIEKHCTKSKNTNCRALHQKEPDQVKNFPTFTESVRKIGSQPIQC